MTGKDKLFNMAYAIGYVDNNTGGKHQRFELGDIDPEWAGYVLVEAHREEELNDSYNIYYTGDFGVEKSYTCLGHVCSGYEYGHVIHLLTQIIEVHQAEKRKDAAT